MIDNKDHSVFVDLVLAIESTEFHSEHRATLNSVQVVFTPTADFLVRALYLRYKLRLTRQEFAGDADEAIQLYRVVTGGVDIAPVQVAVGAGQAGGYWFAVAEKRDLRR